jgi:hypothetical protein
VKEPPLFSGETLEQLVTRHLTNNGRHRISCRTCNEAWTVNVEPKHLRAVYRSMSSEEREKGNWNGWLMEFCKCFPEPSCGHVHEAAGDIEGRTLFHTLHSCSFHNSWHQLLQQSKLAIDKLEVIEGSRFIFTLVRSHSAPCRVFDVASILSLSVVVVATSSAWRCTCGSPQSETKPLALSVLRRPLQVDYSAVERAHNQVEDTRDLLQHEQVLRMVRSFRVTPPHPVLQLCELVRSVRQRSRRRRML